MFAKTAAFAALFAGVSADVGPWSYHGMRHGDAIENEYLVLMKPTAQGARTADFVEALKKDGVNAHYQKKTGRSILGLRGVGADALEKLQTNPDVEMITPNQVVTIQSLVGKEIVDNGVCQTLTVDSWGLARTTAGSEWDRGNDQMSYEDQACGSGVQLHVLDTGVEFGHDDFSDLRDFASGDFTLEGDFDGHGHGTHVASTAAGKAYGFAKCSQVVSLKVLSSAGAGNLFSIVGAMEISQEEAEAGNKVVSNMSLGALANPILNIAATEVADAGVVMAVAAGNDNQDAGWASPASADRVWTVGASAVDDTRSVFSNFGPLVNIFAPGTDIKAACPLETTEHPVPVGECGQIAGRPGQSCDEVNGVRHCYAVISGTSMACPHAAGAAAARWSNRNAENLTNFELQALIERESLVGQLTGDLGEGSPNLLLQLNTGCN